MFAIEDVFFTLLGKYGFLDAGKSLALIWGNCIKKQVDEICLNVVGNRGVGVDRQYAEQHAIRHFPVIRSVVG